MATDDYLIKFAVDANQAVKNIEDFAKKTSDHAKGLHDAFDNVKHVLEAIGVLYVFDKLAESLGEVVSEASKADDEFTKLSTNMKLAGNFTEESRAHFESLSREIQGSTKFSHTQADSALAMAESFEISNEQAEKLVKAAANLAQVEGIDLNEATKQLGKTYTGTAGQLGKLIPGVRDLTKAQLESGEAIDLITKRFGGAAAAATGTFSGAMAQAKNKFDDLLETLGGFITHNAVVVQLIKTMGEAFTFLGSVFEKNKEAINSFINGFLVGIVKTLPPILTGLQFLVSVLAGLGKIVLLAKVGAVELEKALVSLPGVSEGIIFVIKTVSLGVSGLLELLKEMARLPGVKSVLGIAGADVDSIASNIDKVNEKIFGFVSNLKSTDVKAALTAEQDLALGLVDKIGTFADATKGKLGSLKDVTEKLGNNLATIASKNSNVLTAANEKIINQISSLEALGQKQIQEIASFSDKNYAQLFGSRDDDPLTVYERRAADKLKQLNILMADALKQDSEGAQNTIKEISIAIEKTTTELNEARLAAGIGSAGGFLKDLSGSNSGATVVSKLAGAVGDAILPGIGPAVTEIVSILSQGPDAVKKMIQDFVAQVPQIIKAIIQAVPVLITELVKGVPKIIKEVLREIPSLIDALIDSIPDVVESFIDNIPEIISAFIDNAPKIIEKLTLLMPQIMIKLIQAVPGIVQRFAEEFLKVPAQFLEKLLQGLADGIGKIFEKLNPFSGGGLLGGGPGLPSAGVDSTIGSIIAGPVGFLAGASHGFGLWKGGVGGPVAGSASSSATDSGGGQQISIQLVVGERQLADTILQLNRGGYRLA